MDDMGIKEAGRKRSKAMARRSFSYVAADAVDVKASVIKLQQFHRSVHAKRVVAWEACRKRVRDSIQATKRASEGYVRERRGRQTSVAPRDPEGDLINYSPDMVNARTEGEPWLDCLQKGKQG